MIDGSSCRSRPPLAVPPYLAIFFHPVAPYRVVCSGRAKHAAHGDAVMARITQRKGWVLTLAVQEGDFPLFWSPRPAA
jgi:hypothetical protein